MTSERFCDKTVYENSLYHMESTSSCLSNYNFLEDKRILLDGDLDTLSSSNSTIETYCEDTKENRRVSFGRILIREFNIELGDNPSCSVGPPLTIGWQYYDVSSSDVDDFEETRPPRRCKRQMIIPSSVRADILTDVGYSLKDILEVIDTIDKCKKLRKKSRSSIDMKINNIRHRANKLTLLLKGRSM